MAIPAAGLPMSTPITVLAAAVDSRGNVQVVATVLQAATTGDTRPPAWWLPSEGSQLPQVLAVSTQAATVQVGLDKTGTVLWAVGMAEDGWMPSSTELAAWTSDNGAAAPAGSIVGRLDLSLPTTDDAVATADLHDGPVSAMLPIEGLREATAYSIALLGRDTAGNTMAADKLAVVAFETSAGKYNEHTLTTNRLL